MPKAMSSTANDVRVTRALQVLGKFSVELPKKHGRGGQSALRFARLRMEKRHNYVRKVGGRISMDPQPQAACLTEAVLAAQLPLMRRLHSVMLTN